ncbi:venom serine protease 34 [Rhagoletis pomonella]|uniref:venom serine protease 34 n=1 Tax=Rhagoletis pomonella TaxID=28610 RepID=UPI00177ADB19|nr:venom serine protease 34 [Rhagoletis pomonella]
MTSNTKTEENANMTTAHYSTTNTLPTSSSATTQVDISNAFAYLVALFANGIKTSVLIAPAAGKSRKNKKRKCNLRKVAESKRRVVRPAANADSLSVSLQPWFAVNGIENSRSLLPTTATPAETAKVRNASADDLKSIDTLERRDSRIVSHYDGYPAGAGNGRFSCLVEAVESQCDCGWSTYSLKVVSASSVAGVHEFASMAGVLTVKYAKIFCGAVIIHHQFLLSAAHCFISAATNRSELLQVVVGEHDLSTVYESVYTRYYDIDTIILHENFRATGTQVRNDIALLRTRQTIEWNRGVAPACLPFRSIADGEDGRKPPIAGQRVETAGWGSISFGGPQSPLLRTALLDVLDVDECRSALGTVPPATFCTFTPGRDTCQYDSGGGLYLREGGRLFVVGIVSYGYGCATRRPSVNTKVASYIRWIKSQTSQVAYCIK